MGQPLYMDQMTESGRRLSYAKICVEVDSSSTLPNSFDLKYANGDMVEIRIQYPWKPLVCSDCLVFGHGLMGFVVAPKRLYIRRRVQLRLLVHWERLGCVIMKGGR